MRKCVLLIPALVLFVACASVAPTAGPQPYVAPGTYPGISTQIPVFAESAASAPAGDGKLIAPETTNVGIWIPYIMFGDIEDIEMDPNFGIGARFGYNITSESCVELGLLGSKLEASDFDADGNLLVLQVGYVYHFFIENSPFFPFLTIGTGWFDLGGDGDDNGPIIYGGAGGKYMFSEGVFGRLDLQLVQGYGDEDSDLSYLIGLGVDFTF